MKRKAGLLSPPTAKKARSCSRSSTTSSSSSDGSSELPTLSTDSSLKEAQADDDGGEGVCAAVEHAAATPPRTPKSQMRFHCSSPGSNPGQSLSAAAAASRKPTPKAPRKKRPPESSKNIKTGTSPSKAAAAEAGKEAERTSDSEAEEEAKQLLPNLPDGPETYKELFAYPRMNALELLRNHKDHESHCTNLSKVLQHRLIQRDSFSGLGTASITCRRQLEAMVAVAKASHLDWTWIALSWSS